MAHTLPYSKPVPRWQAVKAPHGIGYRIKLLSLRMTRRFQERMEPYGITPFHWLVLCCLWEQDGLATSDLGERLCQVGGTLTVVIDRMEERGLVRRERDQNDRRVWRIWLTDAGRQLEEVLPPVAQQVREEVLQGFSDEQQQQLSDWLDLMIENLA